MNNLNEKENQIAGLIKKYESDAVNLLKEVVNINSGSFNLEGVRRVGDVFSREFEALGFEVEWIPGDAWKRAGHLVARNHGKGHKILLIGHLDTVFEPDSPFQSYTMEEGNIMHGPGALDMKGGDVIMWLALKALKEAGNLEELDICVFLAGDEELSGEPLSLSKGDMIRWGKWADIAIGFEDGDGTAVNVNISRRGVLDWTLTVEGQTGHSSQIFQKDLGYGAIFEAARILNQFKEELEGEENLTFNPGIIAGGNEADYNPAKGIANVSGKTNIIAGKVIVQGDLRTVSGDQLEQVKVKMHNIVEHNNLLHTKASIYFEENGYPPMSMTDGNIRLLSLFNSVSADLGYGQVHPVNPRNSGAADISFVAGDVIMAMDSIGMVGTGGHTVDERAHLNYLPVEAGRTAVLLYRISNMGDEIFN
ncbi:MAG: M20/M25/M40 family metallo-hydrolase [Saprospiraceae bacterium]|nr:M20/M25/M40 family metallo-hydrolase [Saprospiraceae bacterium]